MCTAWKREQAQLGLALNLTIWGFATHYMMLVSKAQDRRGLGLVLEDITTSFPTAPPFSVLEDLPKSVSHPFSSLSLECPSHSTDGTSVLLPQEASGSQK